jgi:excisionase family DNA binding protein
MTSQPIQRDGRGLGGGSAADQAAPLSALPPTLDLLEAARLLGVGRTTAYKLVRTGSWPTPLIRMGRLIRVPTAPLRELLLCGSSDPETAGRRHAGPHRELNAGTAAR